VWIVGIDERVDPGDGEFGHASTGKDQLITSTERSEINASAKHLERTGKPRREIQYLREQGARAVHDIVKGPSGDGVKPVAARGVPKEIPTAPWKNAAAGVRQDGIELRGSSLENGRRGSKVARAV